MQTDATLDQLTTLLDVTYCVLLYTLLLVVAYCWELLRKI